MIPRGITFGISMGSITRIPLSVMVPGRRCAKNKKDQKGQRTEEMADDLKIN